MKVQTVNSTYHTINNIVPSKENPTFNARLDLDYKIVNRMKKDLKFRDIINQFKGWLSIQKPENGVVKIIEKQGKYVEQINYSKPTSAQFPLTEWCRENLEISMGNKKSGFYYNPKNWSENILADLQRVFEYLK